MKTARLEVLSQEEIQTIDAASIQILEEIGIKVSYQTAREIFRAAGVVVDDNAEVVKLPEKLVRQAIAQAPSRFKLFGNDLNFQLQIGGDQQNPVFAGLGTPIRIIDLDSQQFRETNRQDMLEHIILINACENIHNSQMDIWPNDIPMTTIHAEAIWAWANNSRKAFGMGCYGYLPTWDMMRMVAIAVGGKDQLKKHPRFLAICSVVSPLQMDQAQAEGLLICAEYGQPVAMSPEGIAGGTSPVTLAGLLAQENAGILAHITLAQLFRPGTPVFYGTVSTVANMRSGQVALGAPETGLITAASAQLARFYGLPIRSVGGATESKREDIQAGFERMGTLLPAVLARVNLITCAGTLDGTLMESHALLMLDDEICGYAQRIGRGIEVDENSLAMEAIRSVNHNGTYLTEPHTTQNFRQELFIPSMFSRDAFENWKKAGEPMAMDHARDRVRKVLAEHQPLELDPAIAAELQAFRNRVAERDLNDFYAYEQIEHQDYDNL